MRPLLDPHAQTPEACLAALASDAQTGLSAAEAARRLAAEGPNRLTARGGTPVWRRILDQFAQSLVVILIVAAGVSLALGHAADALVIGAVVLVNALIGFFQEHKAESAIQALDALVDPRATVIRDGRPQQIASHSLVRGDLVQLSSGDGVPADLRLIRVQDLQVEEAALTGESVPVLKGLAPVPVDTELGDRHCLAFAGTAVTFGKAVGLVVATGDATQTGRIAGMIAQAADLVTPLTRRIAALSRLLVGIILSVAGALFAFEWWRGKPLEEVFNAAVALAVGAIPEGLPAAVTVLLAVGVQSMARRKALVRKLPAVETLGSTTVICSDKTGTLTENAMTVTHLWTVGGAYGLAGVGLDPAGALTVEEGPGAAADAALAQTALACVLCNDSRVIRGPDGAKVEGDPTEAALLVATEKLAVALDDPALRDPSAWQREAEIPFESEHMYMATLHAGPPGRALWIKGSSDALLPRCASALGPDGQPADLDLAAAQAQVEILAAQGLRVLCLARAEAPAPGAPLGHEHLEALVFLGLVGMIDPPRESARRAIAACHGAGIAVKMITGDHALTAAAIAAQLGLEGAREPDGRLRALTGRELTALSDEALAEAADAVSVFARVAPEQKLRLVEALQRLGHVVAMTGDGVNDAPALKQADLGIAMGLGGTDVARGASAMILTDDNFETIAAAVEEGRGVYDNLVKFITWTLPTNGGEGLVLLAAVALGAALPILPVQILWVNMATAVLLGVALVFEPKEPGLMNQPPRPVDAPLLDLSLGLRTLLVSALIAVAAFGLFEWALRRGGLSLEGARTVAVNTIVVIEVAYLFACRSLRTPLWKLSPWSNPWVWGGASLMLLAQLAFTYVPVMNRLFHSEPIPLAWWLRFTVAGLAVLVLVELYKLGEARWLAQRRRAKRLSRRPAA